MFQNCSGVSWMKMYYYPWNMDIQCCSYVQKKESKSECQLHCSEKNTQKEMKNQCIERVYALIFLIFIRIILYIHYVLHLYDRWCILNELLPVRFSMCTWPSKEKLMLKETHRNLHNFRVEAEDNILSKYLKLLMHVLSQVVLNIYVN